MIGAVFDCNVYVSALLFGGIPRSVDPDDNRVLECALASRCSVIVTGDAHLLDMHPWRGISIVTPRELLKGGY